MHLQLITDASSTCTSCVETLEVKTFGQDAEQTLLCVAPVTVTTLIRHLLRHWDR